MPGRRAFLIGCGGAIAAPVLAQIGQPIATGALPQSPLGGRSAESAMPGPTTPEDLVLRIDGWEQSVDSENPASGDVWIRINSSWRSDWH